MENLLPLIILLPFLGASIIGILGFVYPTFRKQEKLIGGLATAMVAIPFLLLVVTFLGFSGAPIHFSLFSWMKTKNLDISFSYNLDQLSLLMGMIVTGVGSLIHLYSIGYMHHDRGFYKFFLYLNLFIFAMLNLVLGDNFLVLFLGWEGVGACSYFLIGFWYEDMSKAAAAQKAFVANRIGDFALLVAMFLTFQVAGSLNFANLNSATLGHDVAFWIALCTFIAATGKSAQIPLYVWLPDAMAGPTPVSALIHAATMVTSGIYLIARISPVFLQAPEVMVLVAVIGGLTAILAAMIAIAQNDIKKVLAYSTVSQLGFMFMALGAGAFTTAIFHVMTHAFFKACLFLGSGSVIHAMEHAHAAKDPQDIRTMGHLGHYMPSTSKTFWISTIAIAGIPGLSGFFSKDEILGKVFAAGHESTMYYFVWLIGALTALLTAFYMTRVTYLTFNGKARYEKADAHPHESSPLMTIPLWVLAALAIVGGYLGLPEVIGHGHYNWITHHWLSSEEAKLISNRILHASLSVEIFLIVSSILIAFSGMFLAYRLYAKHDIAGEDKVKSFFGGFYKVMENKFYVDEAYNYLIIRPFVYISDKGAFFFDQKVVDGLVNAFAFATTIAGHIFRRIQTGLVQHYALMMFVGILLMLAFLLV